MTNCRAIPPLESVDCSELPCQMFREMKDPNITEEQHQKSIAVRVIRLKER
jgi:hypothetical protein